MGGSTVHWNGQAYTPVYGCSPCMGTGGVLGCPHHGPQAKRGDEGTPFFLRSIPDEIIRARIEEIIEAAVEQRRRGISERLNAALVAIGR